MTNKNKFANIYLLLAITIGVLYVFITPPNATPDEVSHQVKVVRVSAGNMFGADRNLFMPNIQSWYGKYSDSNMISPPYHFDIGDIKEIFQVKIKCTPETNIHNNTVTSYSPLPYFVSAITYKASCITNSSFGFYLYGSRIINLMISILIVYCAMQISPKSEYLFFLIAMLPTVLYQFSSIAADSFVISLTMLYVACIVRYTGSENKESKIFYIFVIVGLCISFSKPGYVWVAAISLPVIMRHKVKTLPFTYSCIWLIIAPLLLQTTLLLLSKGSTPHVVNVDENISFLIKYPSSLFYELFNTPSVYPFGNQWNIYESIIGKLGWLTVPLPTWAYVLSAFNMIIIMTIPKVIIDNRLRFYFIFIGISSIFIMALPLYLYATIQPANAIFGLQGRYFIPSIIIILISICGLIRIKHERLIKYILVPSVICVSITSLICLYTVYYG